MADQCMQFRVEGVVQGVFYRANTQDKARELGLTGWARNEADGTVTVLACGSDESLAKLQDWLWEGPPAAQVAKVTGEVVDLVEVSGFEVR